jgi:hypothetical protein
MYATFAAEQVNMHRVARLQWARDFPNRPNPIELPRNIEQDGNEREHLRENNLVDRNAARGNMANAYIQALYNGQNNGERARIAMMEVGLQALQIQPQPEPAHEPGVILIVNRVLELDG